MRVEPARREDYVALFREAYGEAALSEEEMRWWLDGGRAIQGEAVEEDGRPLGVLSMLPVRMRSCTAGFVCHGVTAPAARGRGVYTEIERRNERELAGRGAGWAFCWTNERTKAIFTGKLGWTELPGMRLWARLRRPTRRGGGGWRVEPSCPPFEARHETAARGEGLVKDAGYLTWRYSDSPRAYHRVEHGAGWAVVRHRVWKGFSVAAVCDGTGGAGVLRRALKAVDHEVALALVGRGEAGAYAAAGFVPSPFAMPLVARRLSDEAPPLPRRRRDWAFSLGDMDFF
ncbi:MAG TPA: hypothetical protein VHD91_11245 [Gaiellaceae bacterium]|nr:hypothetical protein [Gaiellaceae bacterium]